MFEIQEENQSFYQAYLNNKISYSTYRRYAENELTNQYTEFRKMKWGNYPIYSEKDNLTLICICDGGHKGLTVGKEYDGSGCSLMQDEVWVHMNDKGNNRQYGRSLFKIIKN
jgi:hypothetical protein